MLLPTAERDIDRRCAARAKLPASAACTNVSTPLSRSRILSADCFLSYYSNASESLHWRANRSSRLRGMTKSIRRWEISAGGPENLRLTELAAPSPGPHELLIRAAAISLNSRDKLFLDHGIYAQFG